MELISHGFDTIKLIFNKQRFTVYELEELNNNLYGLHQDRVMQKETGSGYPLFTVARRNYTKYPIKTSIDRIMIYSKKEYSFVSFSLARLVNTSNIQPLTFLDLHTALDKLNTKLGFDCSNALIERIDYNFNIGTHHLASSMWDFINPRTDYLSKNIKSKSKESNNSTLYIENDVRKLCCYSQLRNRRYSDSDLDYLRYIKEDKSVNDIIRFEYRFFGDYLSYVENGRKNQFSFSDLGNNHFQDHLTQLIIAMSKDISFTNPESEEAMKNSMEFQNLKQMTCNDVNLQLHAKLLDYMSYGAIRDFIKNADYSSDYHHNKALENLEIAYDFRKRYTGVSERLTDIPEIVKCALLETICIH
jgi:hypothetical protein